MTDMPKMFEDHRFTYSESRLMNSKERFLAALDKKLPDRLPVTTHHLMPYYLEKNLGGISDEQFFQRFGLDPIRWATAYKPDTSKGEYFDPHHVPGLLEGRRIFSDSWRVEKEELHDPQYLTYRYRFVTPEKTLTTILQSNEYTTWVTERLVKQKSDIDIIAKYATLPTADVNEINRMGEGCPGLFRGAVSGFDVYGQPGCWQDASVLFGIEELIMETYEDPEWVHAFLHILQERKRHFISSLKGAKYDLIEHGGGDASTTVISPKIFDDFVAPYDAPLIQLAESMGLRVVYHTCGGMMPILENLAAMGSTALETFSPPGMGGDTDLAEAKRRIGDKICMIGGFDQFHYFKGCTPDETRAAVRRCFETAGAGGGFILSPSDHFFDADTSLLEAFADEARKCMY